MKKRSRIAEYKVITNGKGKREYVLLETIHYYSKRYKKRITAHKGEHSDGATGAFDIHSNGWWIHDLICKVPCWDDGTPITAWQAATVLSDILWSEKRWFRSLYWKISTFLLGCIESRKNGWFF